MRFDWLLPYLIIIRIGVPTNSIWRHKIIFRYQFVMITSLIHTHTHSNIWIDWIKNSCFCQLPNWIISITICNSCWVLVHFWFVYLFLWGFCNNIDRDHLKCLELFFLLFFLFWGSISMQNKNFWGKFIYFGEPKHNAICQMNILLRLQMKKIKKKNNAKYISKWNMFIVDDLDNGYDSVGQFQISSFRIPTDISLWVHYVGLDGRTDG